MVRELFEQQLRTVQDETLELGSMVENAIIQSVEILKNRDMEGSRRLIADDQHINEKRFAIEDKVLKLIATQQPMAIDMRTLAAVLEIITELERMGDYAKGIARINLMIGEEALLKPLIDIPRMAERVRDMLSQSLRAFTTRDVELACRIPDMDDEVDYLYNQIYRELMTYVMAQPKNIDQANFLLWAAHNLERTGDRVVNICERVVFTVTGNMHELNEEDSTNTVLPID